MATIQNLGLTNVDISGNYYVGGLVGYHKGTVKNCYVSGSVSGTNSVGGLVGKLVSGSTISRFYSEASVQVKCHGGGLAGYGNQGSINNCYSRGDVTRISIGTCETVGGFSGYDWGGTITDSYSTGSVYYTKDDPVDKGFVGGPYGSPAYTKNFFDSQASNQTSATGATPTDTGEMKTESTFTNAGWTFGENNWGIDGLHPHQSGCGRECRQCHGGHTI